MDDEDIPSSPNSVHYETLGIPKDASLNDICRAYKSLVMKWHPDKHSLDKLEAHDHFFKITEAYRVLSNKKREESAVPIINFNELKTPETSKTTAKSRKGALKNEREDFISSPMPSPGKGMRNSATSMEDIFSSLSRGPNGINICTPSSVTNPGTPGPGGGDHPSLSRTGTRSNSTPIIYSHSTVRRKPQPIERKLKCTLEELLRGCEKKIKITRDVISGSGLIMQQEEILKIKVKPGWKKGTKITFEGKGDERPGTLPADIIFIIDEKSHPVFTRDGDDLELGVEVPLVEALTGCTISVPILGGENMTLSFDEILYPGYEKIIPGKGMPKPKTEATRGDLRLKFLVEFPTDLSDQQRSQVLRVLDECNYS
ncbi:uncharacterized protein LOC108201071 [Daucus carota subsp. sativus]|uniref:uncharacterized protein LOC108201071 n=1 Tax=Daucus carota subsp. sativus TaxID=79200 RepID=UPI0007DFC049|nr:PREDICTED: dnaJ homolog subfamily B member 1-like [Daucus carota subsp. sativus]